MKRITGSVLVVWMAMVASAGAADASKAKGAFDVKIGMLEVGDVAKHETLGRMSIDKVYHGELDGTGKGEMLTAGKEGSDSGAYVAVERVSGTLAGKKGSFLLAHRATMTKGKPDLSIIVVPESGTDALAGISGHMDIKIEAGGKHFYELEYTLPAR
jgi:hypothetical protein